MKLRSKAGVSSLLASGLAAATLATTGTATAAQIGQVCNVKPGVFALVHGPNYYLGPGAGFRITGFPSTNYYSGHGNNLPEGSIWRDHLDQNTCHW